MRGVQNLNRGKRGGNIEEEGVRDGQFFFLLRYIDRYRLYIEIGGWGGYIEEEGVRGGQLIYGKI